jgi:hypothetical protein
MKIIKDKITSVRYNSKMLDALAKINAELSIQQIVDKYFDDHLEIIYSVKVDKDDSEQDN